MGTATELWQTLEHAIAHYTGLSPVAFFTVLAVALAFYHVVSGLIAAAAPPPPATRREAEPEPLAPLVQLGEVEEEELKAYNGSDPKKPLLMAIKGQIYDVIRAGPPLFSFNFCEALLVGIFFTSPLSLQLHHPSHPRPRAPVIVCPDGIPFDPIIRLIWVFNKVILIWRKEQWRLAWDHLLVYMNKVNGQPL